MDVQEVTMYRCGECNGLYRREEDAQRCCAPGVCTRCGGPTNSKFVTVCYQCQERAHWESAPHKIPADKWEDGVFYDDNFFSDIEELVDSHGEFPEWGVCGAVVDDDLGHLRFDRLLDFIMDEVDEDRDTLEITRDMSKMIETFCDEFNDRYAINMYVPSQSIAITPAGGGDAQE